MEQEFWRRAEALFNAALERAPAVRPSFLDEACAGDLKLRRFVETLIAKEDHPGRLLETSVLPDFAGAICGQAFLTGRQIGPYRILSPLGAGGMGEVYRAHDSKLDRQVAIKTLPALFARDPERMARFRREARTMASLNHPNIATVYELEESAELDCLVLELVEGEALRGPLPVACALDYARQIAEALEAAHAQGIVHRDLKPANVKLTSGGRVKVLDFGLAKALSESGARPGGASGGAAATGISGTPGYMSPEQALGIDSGRRADIWAWGCVLYELLAGRRAFPGDTIQQATAAVLGQEPDWRALPAETPPKIRALLRDCLRKDVLRRPTRIRDVRLVLESVRNTPHRWRSPALAAAALALLAAGLVLRIPVPASRPDRSQWVELTRFPDPVSQPALSPDGRMLAFLRSSSTFFGVGQVYVKRLPDGEPLQLTRDNLAKTNPEFSPDGAGIAYTTLDSAFTWDTWIVPVSGGEARRWRRNVSDLVWAGARRLLYSERPRKEIALAAQDFSARRDVYVPPNDRGVARRPHPSPDGKWVLLSELGEYGDWEPCRVVPMDGSSPGRQVGPPGAECTSGAWSPDGKWIYLTSKAGGIYHIWRQRFPDGRPQQFTSGLTEEEGVAMAPDGRSFVTAVALQSAAIWLHDAHGQRQISLLEGNAAFARFTPDRKKVCYLAVKEVPALATSTRRDLGELWVANLETGTTQPLLPGFPVHDYDVSPDGSQVVIEADDRERRPRLWIAPLDPRAAPRQVPNVEGRQAVFGPGNEIFFRHSEGQSGFAYRVLPDGTGLRRALPQPLLAVTGLSPDGLWIEGWALLPGGVPAVQLFPLRGGPSVIVGGGVWLRWSPGGHSLWLQGGPIPDGKAYLVPLIRGQMLPPIPPSGFHSEDEIARLPGARRIEFTGAPGPSSDIYAFDRRTIQRNLYRIPIP